MTGPGTHWHRLNALPPKPQLPALNRRISPVTGLLVLGLLLAALAVLFFGGIGLVYLLIHFAPIA